MKKINVLSLALAGIMVFSLAGCGDKKDKGDSSENNPNGTENVMTVQEVEKNDLGVTFELNGEYTDCIVEDMEEDEVTSTLEGSLGGFIIKKMVNNTEYDLAKVIVAKNDLITDSAVRARFPFAFNGNVYSVLAYLPMIDTSSADFETIQTLQNNIITTQLVTLFFDESVLPDGNGDKIDIYNTDPTIPNTDITDEVDGESEDLADITDGDNEVGETDTDITNTDNPDNADNENTNDTDE